MQPIRSRVTNANKSLGTLAVVAPSITGKRLPIKLWVYPFILINSGKNVNLTIFAPVLSIPPELTWVVGEIEWHYRACHGCRTRLIVRINFHLWSRPQTLSLTALQPSDINSSSHVDHARCCVSPSSYFLAYQMRWHGLHNCCFWLCGKSVRLLLFLVESCPWSCDLQVSASTDAKSLPFGMSPWFKFSTTFAYIWLMLASVATACLFLYPFLKLTDLTWFGGMSLLLGTSVRASETFIVAATCNWFGYNRHGLVGALFLSTLCTLTCQKQGGWSGYVKQHRE